MGLYFMDDSPPLVEYATTTTTSPQTKTRIIKEHLCGAKRISRRSTLKRLTPGNRRFLISLGFKVNK